MSLWASNWAMGQKDLTPLSKLVLIHMADCHSGQTGRCEVTVADLADLCGVTDEAVNGSLAELSGVGLIAPAPDGLEFLLSCGASEGGWADE